MPARKISKLTSNFSCEMWGAPHKLRNNMQGVSKVSRDLTPFQDTISRVSRDGNSFQEHCERFQEL